MWRFYTPVSKSIGVRALHLFGLCAFAISQPLYATLAGSPEFFVAHRAQPINIFAMVAALTLAVPLLLSLLVFCAGLLGRRVGQWVHIMLVGGLVSLAALITLNRLATAMPALLIGTAIVLGLIAVIAYERSHGVRRFLTIAAAAGIFFPVNFLTLTPVSQIAFANDGKMGLVDVRGTTPVVLVVLDELNPTALLNAKGDLDAARYPNFASLGQSGWWYPNATAAYHFTQKALPAILTGMVPTSAPTLPTTSAFPTNLFTVLGGNYRLNVHETITRLCPPYLCEEIAKPFRAVALWSDLKILYLHTLLPVPYRERWLPPLTNKWNAFDDNAIGADTAQEETPAQSDKEIIRRFDESILADRQTEFGRFVDKIEPGQSTFDFVHILLPHAPYEFLPDGSRYDGRELLGLQPDDTWADDRYFVDLAYQRYMLQLGAVDRLLGQLIGKLKAIGKYDEALIMVTADHGRSFRPKIVSRSLTKENAPDLLHIPMFVKAPGQSAGGRNERRVSSLDVFPTITTSVDARTAPTERKSMLVPDAAEPGTVIIPNLDPQEGEQIFDWEAIVALPLLQWQTATFGSDRSIFDLVYFGDHGSLIGREVSDFETGETRSPFTISYDAAGSQPTNPYLRGSLIPGAGDVLGHPDVAFAVDGKIVAVVPSFETGERLRFSAMLSLSALPKDRSHLSSYSVSSDGNRVSLARIPDLAKEEFSLNTAKTGEQYLLDEVGKKIPIQKDLVNGSVDVATLTDGIVTFHGWSIQLNKKKAASRIAIFACGQFIQVGFPNAPRPDVAAAFHVEPDQSGGFGLAVRDLGCLGQPLSVRIFGVSTEGVASELPLSPKAQSTLAGLKVSKAEKLPAGQSL
jgi:hypothetical protein